MNSKVLEFRFQKYSEQLASEIKKESREWEIVDVLVHGLKFECVFIYLLNVVIFPSENSVADK